MTRAVSESDLAGMAQFLHIEFIMAKRYNVESAFPIDTNYTNTINMFVLIGFSMV